jgi:hypothetical protein
MTDNDEIKFGQVESEPSYYAVIPASVRYDDRISANAKLLFGEVTALASARGYCWATNNYFARLYKVQKNTVSRWLGELVEAGVIEIVIDRHRGNRRRITLSSKIVIPTTENDASYHQNSGGLLNGKSNNTNKKKSSRVPARDFEDDELQKEWEAFQRARKQAGHTVTPEARRRLLKKLNGWNTRTAIAALQQSIEAGYQGVFEPKQRRTGIEGAPISERNKRINVLNRRKQAIMHLTRDLTSAECKELERIEVELRKL